MKRAVRLAASLWVAGLLAGCVWHDGRWQVYGGAEVWYGPFRFWFHDGPWLDGGGWWHGRYHLAPPPVHYVGPRWPRVPHAPRPVLGPRPPR